MTEKELLVDALRRLNRADIPYMLKGSMASNYWGIPRTTHDLDFVVQLPAGSIPKLIQEFEGDFYLDEATIRSAFQPPYQFNAIDTRSALKIDFWLARPIPLERSIFGRRTKAVVFGEQAWLATKEDVILHKLYWNQITPSERQLSDAAGVFAIQKERLDMEYLRHWATEISATDVLEQILNQTIRPKTS